MSQSHFGTLVIASLMVAVLAALVASDGWMLIIPVAAAIAVVTKISRT